MRTMDYYSQACWLSLQFTFGRLLIANSSGRKDGAEAATRQVELCTFYVASFYGLELDRARRTHESQYQSLFEATRAICEKLDESIDFHGECANDELFNGFARKLFDLFHAKAVVVLSAEQPT